LCFEYNSHSQVVTGKELYELYKSKSLDVELAKIASPLEEEKIDSTELSVRDAATGQIETTKILLSEKQYFPADETTSIGSRPAQLVGNLLP
jgi:septin family protein